MGFNSVYRALQDVFPQIDARLLRAVAIEHSKDADVAVEVVLNEVIPYLSTRSTPRCASNENEVLPDSSGAVGDANITVRINDDFLADSTSLYGTLKGSSHSDVNGEHGQVQRDNGDEEVFSVRKCEESSVKVVPDMSSLLSSATSILDNGANTCLDQAFGNTESELIISVGKHQPSSVNTESDQSSRTLDTSKQGNSSPVSNTVICGENRLAVSLIDLTPSPVQELTPVSSENSLQSVVAYKAPEPIVSVGDASKNSSVSEIDDLEEDSSLNILVTRSGQICRIDLLEEIIADARSNKKTLYSAMESVLRLMREVEVQEKAAEQARDQAAGGGSDILTNVEDLKRKVSHAKEASDMHAGEVYGEKAILATEVKEIQNRLLVLSDERDKSLAILDEMRRTLEARFAAAEIERKAAEQEKLQKEESVQNALTEHELIMEKVVEESNILKQEAEESCKLRDFLMDRGRVVDILQGEISVICQDVRLLKERFDKGVPLCKSLSSSQMNRMLDSSSSSLKIMVPYQVLPQVEPSKGSKRTSPSSDSVDDLLFTGEERAGDDRKTLVDDGWEFFDSL